MAVLGSTSLTGCSSIPDFIAAGTLMVFQQTSAPTSWTKSTTHDNKALRVVSGTAGSGGSTAFTTIFTSRAVSGSVGQNGASGSTGQIAAGGTVGSTTLTTAQMPLHSHNAGAPAGVVGPGQFNVRFTNENAPATSSAGQSGSHLHPFTGTQHAHPVTVDQHNHPFSGTALDFAVLYVDIIIASKN